jgi:hypothetical protein
MMKFEQDLSGKLRNIQLGRHKALLPAFEVVVNAFQAIEEAGPSHGDPHTIDIRIVREPYLLGLDEIRGRVQDVIVRDSGVGFTEPNMRSFLTSDSRYKSAKGGKGVGRFMWLKAFERAEIDSHYRDADDKHLLRRHFSFSLTDSTEDSHIPEVSEQQVPSTTVTLYGMKSPYREHCQVDLELIGHLLVEHCLPFFMKPDRPNVTIRDEVETIDLNKYFDDAFAAHQTTHAFTVGEHEFTMKGLRLTNPHDTVHRLLYAADYREVLAEKLERYIPNLKQKRLEDEDGKRFVYLGWIEGAYLDEHANHERTQFSFPTDGLTGSLTDDVTLADIRAEALECVLEDLQPLLMEINAHKEQSIQDFVIDEPEYRPMMRYISEFIDQIPPNASRRELDLALHQQMFNKRVELKQEGAKLIKDVENESIKPEDYEARLDDFLERSGEMGAASLARYVAHRRVMLAFLEKALELNPESGKHEIESVVHKIIYPMRTTSADVPYERQNLWIIDERLAYHGFLASDMPLKDLPEIGSLSKSRPDLMIFERALSFSEDEEWHNSLVIVEFKRPDSFSRRGNEDPIDQVYRLVREIRSGQLHDSKGRLIKVANESIPAYAYVICDTTKEMEEVCKGKGLLPTPDRLGWYGYNPAYATYVEVISYTKLLRDAKRRNKVLFDRLNLPSASGGGVN